MAAQDAQGSDEKISVVEILDNTHGMRVNSVKIQRSKYSKLLAEPGKVDCPLLEALGYPVILVSTKPGRKCIPQVQVPPVSRDQHNNRMATTAASRLSTGLAMGCVVGNCYLLRKDGKSLSTDEWWELWDYLCNLMDDYGMGPGYVTPALLERYKRSLRRKLHEKGIKKGGAGEAGWGYRSSSIRTALPAMCCKQVEVVPYGKQINRALLAVASSPE
jgi:hypothetical protein